MVNKRNKVRARKTARFANKNKLYIGAGILAAGIGIYLLAGDQIKALFKKDDTDEGNNQIKPIAPGVTGGKVTTPTPEPAGLDIEKKLRKGSKGNEVERLQYVINYIAALRGSKAYKTPSGYTVNFPIKPDGDFGSNTQAGAYFISPEFKETGFITLNIARKKLAYLSGYYNKPFPSSLVGTKNYSTYQTSYKAGEIDGSKNVKLNLPDVGLDLINVPTIFN